MRPSRDHLPQPAGENGLKRLAEQNLAKVYYAARQLAAIPGVTIPFAGPHFNEFVVRPPGDAEQLLAALQKQKIIGGLHLGRFYPELKNYLLVCLTETVSREAIDRVVQAFRGGVGSDPIAENAAAGAELAECRTSRGGSA